MRALLWAAVLVGLLGMGLAGCAGMNPNTGAAVLAGGFDVLSCAPDEYAAFKNAVLQGGAGWVAAIVETIQCAGKVYQDVQGSLKVADLEQLAEDDDRWAAYALQVATLVAPSTDDVPLPGMQWTRRGLKRLAKCVRLARSMGVIK